MSEYTPSTSAVRADFIACNSSPQSTMGDDSLITVKEARARFDAWMTAHDAEVAAVAVKEFVDEITATRAGLARILAAFAEGGTWESTGEEMADRIIGSIKTAARKRGA